MQYIRRRWRLILILLSAAVLVSLGAVWLWLAKTSPVGAWSRTLVPWLIENGDLLRAVAAVLSIIGFFVGLMIRRSRRTAEMRETPPLAQVALEDLFARYGRGFTVPWMTRDMFYAFDLARTPRVVITGGPRRGKTRAALELIREAQDATLIGVGRVFEPYPYAFNTRRASILVRQIRASISLYSPLVVFIDDLPLHFTGETSSIPTTAGEKDEEQTQEVNDLENLAEALDALAQRQVCYVVATARPEQMRAGVHDQWLRRSGFTFVEMHDVTPDEQEEIFVRAAETWGLGVDDSARAALRSRHTGAPGLPVRIVGLHAATKFGPTLTAHSVETVAAALDGKDAAADRDRSRAQPRGQIGLFDGFGEAFRTKAASVRSTILRIGNEARRAASAVRRPPLPLWRRRDPDEEESKSDESS